MSLKKEIDFLKYCFIRRKDTQFVYNVMEGINDYSLVSAENIGGEREQDFIYYIKMEQVRSGFFAVHNRLLALLYFADYYGMKPVVEYGEEFCYYEKDGANGTKNPFEYYFEQPSGISLEQLKEYKCILQYRKANTKLAEHLKNRATDGYNMTEEYIQELGRISSKYIKLNAVVSPVIEQAIRDVKQGRRTLGVHVRGTDFKCNYNGHPIYMIPEIYLEHATQIFEKKKYERVFLATDDEMAVRLFKNRFGEALVYYDDVIRSEGNTSVMKSDIKREKHHYRLGLEVLRDMMTLAECEGLIAGLSQVSYSARIQKKSYSKEYDDLLIINEGSKLNVNRNWCQ